MFALSLDSAKNVAIVVAVVFVVLSLLSAWIARRRQLTDLDLWADRLVESRVAPRDGGGFVRRY